LERFVHGQVNVGNRFLADFASQYSSNIKHIPTTLFVPKESKTHTSSQEVIIGWTGSHSTLKYLRLILPVLDELRKNTSFKFHVIANQAPDFSRDYLVFKKWDKETEIEDLLQFDIGLMPLEDTKWKQGKCGFKALQYMALVIPAAISKVGVNSQIIIDGENGFLIDSPEEWLSKLEKLISSHSLRSEIGKRGRESIIDSYSVESQKPNYFNILFLKKLSINN